MGQILKCVSPIDGSVFATKATQSAGEVRAVVAAALHGQLRHHAGDLAQHVTALEADRLGAQVTGGVVGHLVAGRALEVGVEALLVPDRPQVLGGILDRLGELLGALPVLALEQLR